LEKKHPTYREDTSVATLQKYFVNPLNAKLIPICHLLALVRAHHILHVSRIRVKVIFTFISQTGKCRFSDRFTANIHQIYKL